MDRWMQRHIYRYTQNLGKCCHMLCNPVPVLQLKHSSETLLTTRKNSGRGTEEQTNPKGLSPVATTWK